jgi:hypothetical protein
MGNHFKNHRKGDDDVRQVLPTSTRIDPLLKDLSFNDQTNGAWARVRTELAQIADAYGVSSAAK